MSSVVMAALRDGTREQHALVESLGIPRALVEARVDRAAYGAMLRGYLLVHSELERRLRHAALHELAERTRVRVEWLRNDLHVLEAFDRREEARLSRGFAATSVLMANELGYQAAYLAGAVYVLEGSSLGNAILLPRVSRALPHAAEAMSYMRGFGEHGRSRFAELAALLDAAFEEGHIDGLVAGARVMFAVVGQMLAEAEAFERSELVA